MPGITISISVESAAAVQKIEQFFSGVADGLAKLSGFGSLLSGLAPAIAGAFAVDKIEGFVRSIARATEGAIAHEVATGKLARTTGLSVGTMSDLGEAASETHTPLELVTGAVEMFAARAGQAYRLGGQVAQIFRDLTSPFADLHGAMPLAAMPTEKRLRYLLVDTWPTYGLLLWLSQMKQRAIGFKKGLEFQESA